MRIVVAVLSLCFILLLASVGGAELAFQQGVAQKNPELLRVAEHLNPLVSVYFYEDYRLTGDLAKLRRAMRLEPTRPAYHLYYGLALLKRKPRSFQSDREVVIEVCKAARLKPYSAQYKAACEQYKKLIRIPAGT
jgi:hypothetical protein